jgi:hypothetical protein
VALEQRLPGFPDRDVALLWNEQHGWSVGVETSCGEDVIVLCYLGTDILPTPRVVARFVAEAFADDDPPQRLGTYAAPELDTTVVPLASRRRTSGQ